jgi:hypothetical protein
MNRRKFLSASLSGGAAALVPAVLTAEDSRKPPAKGRRYLTINSLIRKYQVEATRTRHMLADETELHSAHGVIDFSNAVRRGFRDARITWAMSWMALTDTSPRYEAIRGTVKELYQQFGDDVTFVPGTYFANAYNSREQVNRDNEEALAIIERFMGGYRPRSIVAGFMAAQNIQYARQHLGVRTIQGNIWSQFSVDFQDGDGSIAYPYYPSTQHFTDYTRDYAEPQGEGQRNWSILGEINQKGTRPQDKPIPLADWSRWPQIVQKLGTIYPNRQDWERFTIAT